MTKLTPFIKKIKTGNGYYIYDVYKNEILAVDRITFNLIEDFYKFSKDELIRRHKKKHNPEEVKQKWEYINKKSRQGYFSTKRSGIDTDYHCKNYKGINRKMFQAITLIPSSSCNLRCKYCVYSGTYYYNRRHGNRRMTVETARKTLKLLKLPEKNRDASKQFYLNFFGGEPLLNMGIIKYFKREAVRRINSTDERFTLVIETNGTLLTPQVADYLVKSNIFLSVSLDGPKKLHDRYRVYKNGRGSFDKLFKNLLYIKRNYPEYYQKISFTIVLDPPFYETMKEHFDDIIDLISNNRIKYSKINPYDTNFFKDGGLAERVQYIDNLREKFVRSMVNGGGGKEIFLKSYFLTSLTNSLRFMMKDKDAEHREVKKSICLLGGDNPLVDADGSLTPCIEFWTKGIKMGNVDTGLNLEIINHYIKQFRDRIIPHCKDCWLIRYCGLCPPLFLERDTITPQKRELLCRAKKEKYLKDLQMTLSIIEKKPEALAYIENYRTLKDILPSKREK